MKDNKDVIRQILLDFDKFITSDVWMCGFDKVVDEFIAVQGDKYSFDLNGLENNLFTIKVEY